MSLVDRLSLDLPIIQAPMAGVSTPAMAAGVSNAGALGSIAVGATDPAGAEAMVRELESLTDRPFNVNLFVHATPRADPAIEAAWLDALAPTFSAFGAVPPAGLQTIYRSFNDDDAMLRVLVERAPRVVSFHFGLPDPARVRALKGTGCLLIASATSPEEARLCVEAGMDAVVAQGYESGGHRGVFDPDGDDAQLGTVALTRLLVRQSNIPVIAAGGIMDGQGVRAALDLGAVAAQLGTAFIACPESAADAVYRAVLASDAAHQTTITRAISGRPARCLRNRFTELGESLGTPIPAYPIAYDAGKALNAAAKAAGETGFGAQWAGQGSPLTRAIPAAELVATLAREMAI